MASITSFAPCWRCSSSGFATELVVAGSGSLQRYTEVPADKALNGRDGGNGPSATAAKFVYVRFAAAGGVVLLVEE